MPARLDVPIDKSGGIQYYIKGHFALTLAPRQAFFVLKEAVLMIIFLKNKASDQRVSELICWLDSLGVSCRETEMASSRVLCLTGDIDRLDGELLAALDIVDSVQRVSEPYKAVSRSFHPEDSVIDVGDVHIGGGSFAIIAGPCSVESSEQIKSIAEAVKAAGAGILRGGAFKPRTSPYDFQGLRADGIELLLEAKKRTGLPVVTEIMSAAHLPLFENVDMIQVGARNMQNFELLKALGKVKKPILLKRGLANTINELLMAAEYIMAGGNDRIVLCERGIRTFETATRNTLDLSAVPVLHEKTHLPVLVDPSHGTGHAKYVASMALAAAAAGCDGLIIEVHNDPPHALCDGAQSLTPGEFAELSRNVCRVREVLFG